MATVARATVEELAPLDALAKDGVTLLRRPEIGLVMVRGRIGGDGAPFNMGEATVTRAAVSLPGGEVGFGHVLGRAQGEGAPRRPCRCAVAGPGDRRDAGSKAACCMTGPRSGSLPRPLRRREPGRRHPCRLLHHGPRRRLMAIALAFADPVHDAQKTFRAVMDALARPGTHPRPSHGMARQSPQPLDRRSTPRSPWRSPTTRRRSGLIGCLTADAGGARPT